MYNNGHGTYNDTARSFHNVNPVYNPEDNGRASPQFPTQHVPIYNPALSPDHMLTQAKMSREHLETGGIVNYATRGMHAENYSLLESQNRAKTYSNVFSGLGTATKYASIIGGLALGVNPIGLAVMGAATLGQRMFDKSQRYYEDFSNRMGHISDLRNMYAGAGGIVNPYTGNMSAMQASNLASGFENASLGTGFSEQDMYTIHSLAGKSGMMRGHTGSIGKVTSRITALAKMTKQIMSLGEGIDAHQAMEMQQLTQVMDIDLGKFKSLEIARKVVSAAKLTNKSIQATNAMIASAASASNQVGLGGQMGAESALYMSRFAAPQFAYLSAKQQAAVGGSQDAYVQNLVSAQVNFAARNAQTLALGSYYVDPMTGKFKVDTGEIAAMAHRGYDPTEAYKRGMGILSKENRAMLRDAGIKQNFVTSMLQENMGSLSKTAINAIDNDTQTAMAVKEIVRFAADNGVSFKQAAGQLGYSEQQAAAMTTFMDNYGKGGRRAFEQDRISYLEELSSIDNSLQFTSRTQRKDLARRQIELNEANNDAATAAARADRAGREESGLYYRRGRSYTDDEISASLRGGYNSIIGRSTFGRFSDPNTRYGVYMGMREKDVSRGFMADALNYSGHDEYNFFTRSVADRAIGKDVLSKIYDTEFYGEGSDVARENMFGVDTSIMGRIARGSTLSTDNLNASFGDEGGGARGLVTRALQEIFGGNFDFEGQLSNIKDKNLRERLRTSATVRRNMNAPISANNPLSELTGDRAQNISEMLAAVGVTEIAAFSDIGRNLRTVGARDQILDSLSATDADKVQKAGLRLTKIINNNASSNENILPTDNSADAIQHSRSRLIDRLHRETGYGRDYIKNNLEAILAASYESSPNSRKALTKLFSVSERARGMLSGGARTILDPTGAVFTQKGSNSLDPTRLLLNTNTITAPYMIAQYLTGTPSTAEDRKGYSISNSELVLGKETGSGPEAAEAAMEAITNRSISLVNAVKNLADNNPSYKGPREAQNVVSDMIYEFVQYASETAGTDVDMDSRLKQFLRVRPTYRELLDSLETVHSDTIKTQMKQQASATDVKKAITSNKISRSGYRGHFASIMGLGTEKLRSEAIQDFLKDSTATAKLFGGKGTKTLASQAERARELFTKLEQGTALGEGAEFRLQSGATDIDGILSAMGFTAEDMGEENYENLRSVAQRTFRGGNVGLDNQKKFALELQKQIQQGKIKNVGGVGGKGSNAALMQSALQDMHILQSATAKILTALTMDPEKGKVELGKVAGLLKQIQSAQKV